jgi:hypothetical protein
VNSTPSDTQVFEPSKAHPKVGLTENASTDTNLSDPVIEPMGSVACNTEVVYFDDDASVFQIKKDGPTRYQVSTTYNVWASEQDHGEGLPPSRQVPIQVMMSLWDLPNMYGRMHSKMNDDHGGAGKAT